jgi:hypothetical protein
LWLSYFISVQYDVTPTVCKDSLPAGDTIRDTVYKSCKNGKLFGVETNTYVKRKSIKDPINNEAK